MIYFARPALRRLLLTAAFLFAPFSAWSQSEYSPPFWEVRSENSTVYLFGTIHVGRPDFYPLPPAIEAAFEKSDMLALEVDPANDQQAVAAVVAAMYAPPDNIENHLSPSLLSKVLEVSSTYGVPFEQLRQMKPYLLMFTLTTLEYARLGYSAQLGLETYFSQRARNTGKQITALETMAQQMQMLDQLSLQLQTAMLEITVDELANGEVAGLVADMAKSWQSGNIEALDAVLNVEKRRLPDALANEFHQRFLSDRNLDMARKIENMLSNDQTVFVAIGALHMVGADAIPALLAGKGYQVKGSH